MIVLTGVVVAPSVGDFWLPAVGATATSAKLPVELGKTSVSKPTPDPGKRKIHTT